MERVYHLAAETAYEKQQWISVLNDLLFTKNCTQQVTNDKTNTYYQETGAVSTLILPLTGREKRLVPRINGFSLLQHCALQKPSDINAWM